MLSPLGLEVEFPADIPFQAAQAKDKEINATIGQITDGRGAPIVLPSMASSAAGFGSEERGRAFLYSPVAGIEELRQLWRSWQHRDRSRAVVSTLPMVTVGLTHGLSLIADLFSKPGQLVAVPQPFWGNYRQTFRTRTGATVVSAPTFDAGRFNCEAIEQSLADAPRGQHALAILNLPSNPGGYMPSEGERARIRDSLIRVADQRNLLVICDDAYQGLVYEPVPRSSMYWDLVGLHERLIPVKVDGATKELAFFGGRVGFLTFPFEPGSPVAEALESKVKCLLRATVGSPVSMSQMIAISALRSATLADEIEEVRLLLASRYRRLRESLTGLDPEQVRTLPFNAGCFALLALTSDSQTAAERVRQRLLAEFETGLIAIAPNYLRIAYCSIAEETIPTLVERIDLALNQASLS